MLGDISRVDHIYLACGYTDLRRGIDGLAQIVQQQFELDPFSNSLFLFCGKRRDRIKALLWEGDGFVLLYKRMENGGGFQWPRSCAEMRSLSWQEFRWLTEDFPLTNPKQIRGWNGAFCEVKFSTKNQAVFAADLIEFLQEVLCADSSQCELFCCIIG